MIEELPEVRVNHKPKLWLLVTVTAILSAFIIAGLIYLILWSNQPSNKLPFEKDTNQNYYSSPDENEFQFNLPVLTYHYIRTVPNPDEDKLGFRLSVIPSDFYEQMNYLVTNHYTTITPDDLYTALKNKKSLPPKSVLLTFDDGYADFYQNAFPILKELNLKATVFVVTGFVGDKEGRYLSWDQIKEIDKSGLVTIGSHTIGHVNVTTSKNARNEIYLSKKTLEQRLGHSVMAFCYPGGRYNLEAVSQVAQAGYRLGFTTDIGTVMQYNERFMLPRVRISGGLAIKQFPLKLLALKNKPMPATPAPSPTPSPATVSSSSPTPNVPPSFSPSPMPSSSSDTLSSESPATEETMPLDEVEELLE
jgi:peptidoglycan/xylan/chitin deacetylase (PgdA/CDA1 family)